LFSIRLHIAQVGPCVDFWLWGLVSTVFAQLLKVATGSMSFDVQRPASGKTSIADDSEDYRAVAGRRYAATMTFISDPTERIRIAMLALLIEPLRHLHVYFLASSKTHPKPGSMPAILDLLNPESSVLISVCQYYSSLLRGSCSRLCLIWHIAGSPTAFTTSVHTSTHTHTHTIIFCLPAPAPRRRALSTMNVLLQPGPHPQFQSRERVALGSRSQMWSL
jgi:hypothetical protein